MEITSSLFPQFEPEALEQLTKRLDLQPEKKLMLAVLEDAIKCLNQPQRQYLGKNASDAKRARLRDDTRRWFECNDEDLMSFRSICQTLGLHPDYVRKGILSHE